MGISAVAFGLTTVLRKLALTRLHPFQYESLAGLVHVILIPLYLSFIWRVGTGIIGPWDKVGLFWTLIATLVNTVGTIVFMFALRQQNDAGFVSSLAGASPIITLMLSALFLGERPDIKQAIGVAFVLAGVVIASGR